MLSFMSVCVKALNQQNLTSFLWFKKSEQKKKHRNLGQNSKHLKHCWFKNQTNMVRIRWPSTLEGKNKNQEEFNGGKNNKPDPLRPVIHITQPFCLRSFSLSIFSTGHSCHFMFVEFPIVDNWLWFLPIQNPCQETSQKSNFTKKSKNPFDKSQS